MKPRMFVAILGLIVLAALAALVWFLVAEKQSMAKIGSFEACAENGFLIQKSLPRQCVTPDGRVFVENVKVPGPTDPNSPTDSSNPMSVSSPAANDTIFSPLAVTGQARGFWFFEASFPIELRDASDRVVATGIAQAQGDWMTEEFVPFSSTISFENLKEQKGFLVLKKDNPSGLPELDDSITIPVNLGVRP